MSSIVHLDGSQGEGGGQILRTSLALSLLTGKSFHLHNVRAGRTRPGLQPQHLACVRAAAAVGQAHTVGASRNSTELLFEPGPIKPGPYTFDVGTAGATGLVLHTVYLPLALRGRVPSEVAITGGTHVPHSPCFHFLDITWRRYLEHCGLLVRVRMDRPGFYPRGGGRIVAHIQPSPRLAGLKLGERGEVRRARGFSAVAGLDAGIARRQARRAEVRLRDRLEVHLEQQTWEGGPGTVLAVEVDTQPVPALFFGLGERGKRAERVADEAVEEVRAYLDSGPALVDAHSADQFVLPLALAEGSSEYQVAEVTRHLTTNIAVIRQLLDRDIACEGAEGGPGTVCIR
jgi:RNA 3'-terminal phosphate cyclase (ATP)